MTIKRLDHISVVVDDLADSMEFFTALGMTVEGQAPVEGPWLCYMRGPAGIIVALAEELV
jgi:catechol 2,3-dioxygenase-like lactoylglutathione lyase family enzyme